MSLPPIESRLRLALRAVRPAPDGARDRVRAKLAAALPFLDLPSHGGGASRSDGARDAGGGPRDPSAIARSTRTLGAGKAAAIAFVLGGLTGASLLAAVDARKPPRVVYVDRTLPAAPVTASISPAPVLAPVASTAALAKHVAPPAVASEAPKHAPTASSTSRFAAERMLLDEARAALVRGEPQEALERLDRHRARFADGMLAQERDAMRVEALVGAGRYDEARAAAREFHARDPDSLFLSTVDAAIASIP